MIFDMLSNYILHIEEINDTWKIIIRKQIENEFAIYMLLKISFNNMWLSIIVSQNDYLTYYFDLQ